MVLGYIIFFRLLSSIGSVLISALFLVFPDKIQKNIIAKCISFATGTLLGAAFLGLVLAAVTVFFLAIAFLLVGFFVFLTAIN